MKPTYESPLASRYASKTMLHLFSPDMRYETWRRLWVALARAEHTLGLPVTQQQVDELAAHVSPIDYDAVAKREKEVRHDVMAHIYAYGLDAPGAKGIIHLGATSCYVTDNADLIIYREALRYLEKELKAAMRNLCDFADRYAAMPALAYTHYQPAQLTTIGKRASLWLQDLLLDLEELQDTLRAFRFLGCRGTTGTEASFVELFDGDTAKIDEMNRQIAAEFGFDRCYPVCGQTYPRKLDSRILNVLSSICQSACRMATDIRLLQHDRQVEEPFEDKQIGSSAMPYKRNPMRCERICSLARYVIADAQNAPMTAMTQWLERTLDDSANRRISLPEAFLCHRRRAAARAERHKGAARQREDRGEARVGLSAVHCDGESDDGRRQARRRPPAAARDHPRGLHGGDREDEKRRDLGSGCPAGRPAGIRHARGGDPRRAHPQPLHRPLPGAGRRAHGRLPRPDRQRRAERGGDHALSRF